MEYIIYIIAFAIFLCLAGLCAAVCFSEPAPDWYEIEEQNRRNWYK